MTASDVRDLLDGMYASFHTGETAAWTDHMAEDVVAIGTDPGEWWDSRTALGPAMTAQLREMSAAGIRFTEGAAHVVDHGDFVWVADRPTIHLGDGTEVATRFTVIASRRDDQLQIEHFHLSVGASNEDVLDQELTI
jgi:ketosteroid isomerase-like protein